MRKGNTAGLAQPGSQVAAVSPVPGDISVFFAGTGNKLYWSHWSSLCGSGPASQCGWSSPVVIDSGVPTGAAITAVARIPDHLDIFYVGTDGAVHTDACAGYGSTGNCQGGAFYDFVTSSPGGCAAPQGAGIAATARGPYNIDLFYAANNESVCTSAWPVNGGWSSWSISQTNLIAPGSQISAVTRSPNNLDVFFMYNNGNLGDFYQLKWANGSNWAGADISPGVGAGVPGGAVGAASRQPSSVDVFSVGWSPFSPSAQWSYTGYWNDGQSGWGVYENDSY